MEHCKKLVLIPHESVARLQEKTVSRTSTDVMNDLDKEMHRILKQKAEDSEKWKLYEQALQKYLYFVNERKKPVALFVPEAVVSKTDITLKEKLLSITPPKFREPASFLFDHLCSPEAKKLIRWDISGKTSVDGQTLPNIVDLISDVVRTRKTPQVDEWETFASVLKALDTPLTIIGNTTYVEALKSQSGSGFQQYHNESSKRKQPNEEDKQENPKGLKGTKWRRWT